MTVHLAVEADSTNKTFSPAACGFDYLKTGDTIYIHGQEITCAKCLSIMTETPQTQIVHYYIYERGVACGINLADSFDSSSIVISAVTCRKCLSILNPFKSTENAVEHPYHYAKNPEGLDAIQVLHYMNFTRGMAVK